MKITFVFGNRLKTGMHISINNDVFLKAIDTSTEAIKKWRSLEHVCFDNQMWFGKMPMAQTMGQYKCMYDKKNI